MAVTPEERQFEFATVVKLKWIPKSMTIVFAVNLLGVN